MRPPFVDIHCHLLPGVDDGPADLEAALAMARMAATDGTLAIVATPHQLGSFAANSGERIRGAVAELQRAIAAAGIPLDLLPGGDVRIEDDLPQRIRAGDVLTLGDRGRHLLLELPHELYLPLCGVLESLRRMGVTAILSHPERNAGLLAKPALVGELVDVGCLMQVTAGSFTGAFGPASQRMAESLLANGLVHFVASDGHGPQVRRPLLSAAFERISEIAGEDAALDVCCRRPALIAAGDEAPAGRRRVRLRRHTLRHFFFSRMKAA